MVGIDLIVVDAHEDSRDGCDGGTQDEGEGDDPVAVDPHGAGDLAMSWEVALMARPSSVRVVMYQSTREDQGGNHIDGDQSGRYVDPSHCHVGKGKFRGKGVDIRAPR